MTTRFSQHAKYTNFGKAINQNINRNTDPQNPLTTCIFPTLGSMFLHGSSQTQYRPQCPECQNFMADRCSGMYRESEAWDEYCDLYSRVNTDTVWPNTAAMDNIAAMIMPTFRQPRTTGEQLIRNTLERRFLVYPYCQISKKQFDQNVPNSPYYHSPCGYCTGAVVKNMDAKTLDQDRVMNAGLDNFTACADVFAIIWSAWKNGKLSIKGTKLEKNLMTNSALYNDILGRINNNVARYMNANSDSIGTARPTQINNIIYPLYEKGVPNCK